MTQTLLFLFLSSLWFQLWFESDGCLFDSVLLSAGQSEKSVSILLCLELQESMCDRFCWTMCAFKTFFHRMFSDHFL